MKKIRNIRDVALASDNSGRVRRLLTQFPGVESVSFQGGWTKYAEATFDDGYELSTPLHDDNCFHEIDIMHYLTKMIYFHTIKNRI